MLDMQIKKKESVSGSETEDTTIDRQRRTSTRVEVNTWILLRIVLCESVQS